MTGWLITGVGGGLGRAVAKAALAAGDVVAGTVRSRAAIAAFEVLAPGRAVGLIMEASDPDSIARAVECAEHATGGIEVLVANAGRGLVGALEETSLDEMRALFEVNVFGPIAAIQAVLPLMRGRGGGRIVNITSVSGLAAWVGTSAYGATKHAMECVGETLANEVREHGITVVNVASGGLRTEFGGRSLARAGRRLAAYDGAARDAERTFASSAGHEAGDPERAAAAILAIVRAEDPPMHLLLGEDALHYAETAMDRLTVEISRWRSLSASTMFDQADAAKREIGPAHP